MLLEEPLEVEGPLHPSCREGTECDVAKPANHTATARTQKRAPIRWLRAAPPRAKHLCSPSRAGCKAKGSTAAAVGGSWDAVRYKLAVLTACKSDSLMDDEVDKSGIALPANTMEPAATCEKGRSSNSAKILMLSHAYESQ